MLFRTRSGVGYLMEVGLIIFSILFAFWIDRLREGMEKEERLRNYLREISADLKDEIETTSMNLYDCKNDIRLLRENMEFAVEGKSDSTARFKQNFLNVYYRGVYRGFSTLTIEIMATQGDLDLLKDDSLQKQLLSVFGFRDMVRNEFRLFDEECTQAAKILFEDLQMMDIHRVRPDPAAIYNHKNTQALFSLMRRAEYKGFILNSYLEDLKAADKRLKKRLLP